MKTKIKLLSMFTATIVTSAFLLNSKVYADDSIKFNRIYGKDRYETSSKIIDKGWNTSYYAVIASGESFADALSATPLAKKYKAPIILTKKDQLTRYAKDQLKRLSVKEVIIVGGKGAIDEDTEQEIKDCNVKVTRVYGDNRYDTSLEVAKKIGVKNGLVVTIGENFTDALSMAAIAASKQMPIILTHKQDLSNNTKKYLKGKSYKESYVLGGTGVVSDKIKNSLKNSTRLYGRNRYATNVAILNHFKDDFLELKKSYITAGSNYPDALAISALACNDKSPIILMDNTPDSSTKKFISDSKDQFKEVTMLGGSSVINDYAINDAFSIVGDKELINDESVTDNELIFTKTYDFCIPRSGKIDLDYHISNFGLFKIKIVDEKDEIVVFDKFIGGKYLKDSIKNIRLGKGDYKLSIEAFKSRNQLYGVKLLYTEENEGYEKEFNDNIEKANIIPKNNQIQGSINNFYDDDYYKFTLKDEAYVKLNFKHPQLKKESFKITLLDEKNNVIKSFNSLSSDIDLDDSKIKLDKGAYYIKVRGDGRNLEHENYDLKVNVDYNNEDLNYESESNDNYKQANWIKMNREYKGNIGTKNDVDYYKIYLGDRDKIRVNFSHPKLKRQAYKITLLNNHNMPITSCYSFPEDLDKTLVSKLSLREGTYYIKIEGDGKNLEKDDYTLEVN